MSKKNKLLWIRPLMVLAFLIGAYLVYLRVNYESRDFVEEYFEPYPVSTFAGGESAARLNKGLELYSKKDYTNALVEFNSVDLDSDDASKALLYAGICSMISGNEKDLWAAITTFEAAKMADPLMTQEAEWYKTLCYIELDRKEDAIKMLTYYTEQQNFTFKQREAKELLAEY